ncbi:unnamed protein product [Amoebophrya sp. A25]|nr:unnamed protein product [Amoebophrya sp. A25]|eukprot:GSA25T00018110001.1
MKTCKVMGLLVGSSSARDAFLAKKNHRMRGSNLQCQNFRTPILKKMDWQTKNATAVDEEDEASSVSFLETKAKPNVGDKCSARTLFRSQIEDFCRGKVLGVTEDKDGKTVLRTESWPHRSRLNTGFYCTPGVAGGTEKNPVLKQVQAEKGTWRCVRIEFHFHT